MARAPSILELHKQAIKHGFPAGQVHEILHDMAVIAFEVGSLTELTADQRRRLDEYIHAHDGRPSRPHRPARPRRGRPARDGIVRMITPAQRELIHKLVGELGWTASQLDRWLAHAFGVHGLTEVRTAREAKDVIQRLIAIKRDRQRRRREYERRQTTTPRRVWK